jgi:hypothetical protein
MNVYYLPTYRENDTPEMPLTASHWSVLQARAHRAWWRMRLTLAEVYAAIRRGGRNPIEEHIWIPADEMPAPRRRPVGPARVLDLDAARRRRALTAAAV